MKRFVGKICEMASMEGVNAQIRALLPLPVEEWCIPAEPFLVTGYRRTRPSDRTSARWIISVVTSSFCGEIQLYDWARLVEL